MPISPITTEIRCELSKKFPIANGDLDLLRYQIKLLPSKYEGCQEAILVFQDEIEKGYSNPAQEGEIVLSVLALFFDCRIKKTGYRVNGADLSGHTPINMPLDGVFCGEIATEDFASSIAHLFTLGDELTKQFVRACNAYSLAIASAELDHSLSFLLLVTALECLATQEEFCPNSKLDKSAKSAERYSLLVRNYCDKREELYSYSDEEAFFRDLKTVYYSHRSAFVHGGKEVSVASRIADQAGFNNIGHFIDGKEIFTPSLKWFFQVTRRTLMGFLVRFPRDMNSPNHQILADIAQARAILTVRLGE